MRIISILILHRMGHADYVSLRTDLPEPVWPFKGTLDIRFDCAAGTAEVYVAQHWPEISVEVVGETVK
jgi:hypothetical protein